MEKGNETHKVLTIVVPSYNVEKYLPDVIPTYLEDEILPDIELLIVNDGSKDKTAEIAAAYERKHPESIRLINKANGGHGSTINRGLQEATGKYFKVIDGDDWVDTEQFTHFVSILKSCDADLVLNSYNKVNVDSGMVEKSFIQGMKQDTMYSLDTAIPLMEDFYAMHGTTFRTEVIKDMRQLDEHCFYVDQEFILFPLPEVKSVVYYDIPVYQYRVGNVDQSMSLKNMQKNRDMHKRVIFSLMEMDSIDNNLYVLAAFMKHRICKMIQLQIDIIISLPKGKGARDELVMFLGDVKKRSPELYKDIPGKKAALLRMAGGAAYYIIKMIKKGE